ncbi:hypothetical protein BN903_4 [Halorubrum sp. AJ67]|nr:hypothetical protein BN903_4 [Halorubrum sp. AJ67]
MGLAVDGHLSLLHRLQQRGLRLRRGAIDLVGEDDVREDRSRREREGAVALVEHVGPGHVGGEEVGGELDPRELQAERGRERARREGLSGPGHVFEEDVAAGEDTERDAL